MSRLVAPLLIMAICLASYQVFAEDLGSVAQKCPATRIECESRPWIYPVSRIALYSGFTADLITTLKLDGKTREENPLASQSPIRQLVLVGGASVAVDLLTHSLHREHPKAAAITNFILGGIHFGAAGWNMHVMETYR